MPGSVELQARTTGKADALYLAVTQNGLQTQVTAGENKGERLGNDFVARSWSGPLRAPGTVHCRWISHRMRRPPRSPWWCLPSCSA